jgi:hypothetical protein
MLKTEDYGETLTVGELIDLLAIYDYNLPVITEGCDCWGAAHSVEYHNDTLRIEPHLLIKRDPDGT